jgi:hypothetical protein
LEWRLFKGSLHGPRLALYLRTVEILEEIALSDVPARSLKWLSSIYLQKLSQKYKELKDTPFREKGVSGALATLRKEVA